ncbi:MAG: FISUMP domain-containing protein [Mariniphaga sp.]
MKKLFCILLFLLINSSLLFSQVAINTDGTNPDNSAMLDVKSTGHGILIPRISTLARNQIPSPATGLMIYNTTTNLFNFYNGTYWYEIGASFISSTTGNLSLGGGVSINSSQDVFPENSAMLDVNNPTRGILIPRTIPELVISPATGLIIYNTNQNILSYYDGVNWITLCAVSTGIPGAIGKQEVIGMANKTDGSLPHHSAMLDVAATDKGVLIPRLTNAQRDAILPVTGLVIYNTSANKIEFYNGSGWYQLTTNCSGLPIVTTNEVTDIMATMATSSGTVTSDGGASILKRGVCWAKTANPTIADSVTTDSIGTGNFISRIHRLLGNTTYYVRAYATNSSGTAYGNEVLFKTNRIDYLCGNDSIILYAENKDNKGVIEWQESIDTLTWVTIPETVGETYRFLPTQTKYYRAAVAKSGSATIYSAFTFVQLPPVIISGPDRVIGGRITKLRGNQSDGETGEWLVISGDSGIVAEPRNPYSQFTGKYNQDYQLTWTLANSCGQSTDTINIRFEKIVAKNNFIVVDNTDLLLSDSTEMAHGIYRIKFSDPEIAPYDSVMLIGMRDNLSFLRKVGSFTLQDGIYNFATIQGRLDDLFNSGPINIGDAINQGVLKYKSANLYGSSAYPTRQTLKENAGNNGLILLYSGDNLTGNRMKSGSLNDNGLMYDFSNTTIFQSGPLTFSITKGNITFEPNFIFDVDVYWNRVTKIAFYADNAALNINCDVNLNATQAVQLIDREKKLSDIDRYYTIMVGIVPIVVVVNTKLVAKLSADVNAVFDLNAGFTNNYKITLGAVYENSTWTPKYGLVPSFTAKPVDLSGTVQFDQKFSITPEVSVKLYGVAGPYCTPELFEQINANVASPSLDWDALLKVGVNTTVGADITIFGKTLANFAKTFTLEHKLWNAPDSIVKVSGDKQTAMENQVLVQPIKVKVIDNVNFPLKNVFAYFDISNGGGSVEPKSVKTDAEGFANAYWTLGTGTQELTVSVKKADGTEISTKPVTFTATAKSISISKYSGDNQKGDFGQALPAPIKVLISDSDGKPISGIIVKFAANNLGSVSQVQSTTGADGIATVNWTLGSVDESQTLTVTCFKSDGVTQIQGSPLTFAATCGCATFMLGNYEAVQIGTQVWMAKNLNIPVTGSWVYPDAPAEYGRLYDWDAARAACPAGWHIPSNAEWDVLIKYLGGYSVAGGKMKETGTAHWLSPNTGATNSSCFTALPGGIRIYAENRFTFLGKNGAWWSSTPFYIYNNWWVGEYNFQLWSDEANISELSPVYLETGLSVRCIRD